MNGATTELDERARVAHEAAIAQQQHLKEFNLEQGSGDGRLTDTGRARKHLPTQKAGLLMAASDSPLTTLTNAMIVGDLTDNWKKAVEIMSQLSKYWQSQIATSAKAMAIAPVAAIDALDPRATVTTFDVQVPHSVYEKMMSAEIMARSEIIEINDIFAKAGCHGPHPAQKPHYETLDALERTNMMRYDHAADEYSFCANHLHDISLGAIDIHDPARDTLKAFFVIAAPQNSRGLKVNVTADGDMTQNDLQVAEKAAPVVSVPPHLKAVLGR